MLSFYDLFYHKGSTKRQRKGMNGIQKKRYYGQKEGNTRQKWFKGGYSGMIVKSGKRRGIC